MNLTEYLGIESLMKGMIKMIDSLNIVLHRIEKLDKEYISSRIGIDEIYDFTDEDGKCGITFSYKTIKFDYYFYGNLVVETTTHKVLDKKDISLSDKDEYKNQTMKIIKEVIGDKKYKEILLTQNDYCADLDVGADKITDYYILMNNGSSKYKHKERKRRYDTSIHLTTDGGKIIKGYGKLACIRNKANLERRRIIFKYTDPEIRKKKLQELNEQVKREVSLYNEGSLRLEIAIRKDNLKYYFEASKKKRERAEKDGKSEDEVNKIPIEYRTIENYWNEDKMRKLFLDEVKQYFYSGKYYKLSKAVQIIESAETYSNNMKNKLILFLCRIRCAGIDRVKNCGVYSKGTIYNRIKDLSILNINPITIDEESKFDMLESLYSLAVKKCEVDYFK